MRKKLNRTLGVLSLTALLAACSQQSPTAVTPNPTQATPVAEIARIGNISYVKNEVVVAYESDAGLQAAAAALNGTVVRTIPEIRTALILVSGDALKVVGKVSDLEGVRYATINTVVTPEEAPTPVLTPSGLTPQAAAADQIFDELPQYALDPRHLNARTAWDKGLTGKGVVVAVIDDPGDVTHPDLAPNWAGKAFDPVQAKTYTNGEEWKNYVKKPENSHGTFVASSIVAPKDGKGIVGVAHEAKFMPVMMFNPGAISSFNIALGAVWATNNGARVINNSWGGGISFGPVKDAFDYAMSNGTVIVASMGNSYHDEFQYPAALPGVMASGALDASNRKVTFSTSGRHISSSAPGQDTMLANPTWLGGGHRLISGTSFSSPYTAGVAALVLQKCPAATPYQVRRVMEMNADGSIGTNPNGFDRETGWGRLDAGKIAHNLTDCAALPAKGANVHISLSYVNGQGTQKGILGDVILRGQGMRAGATDDPTPLYLSPTDANGEARFSEIAPGTYDLYVAGPDLTASGGKTEERGTFIGTLTATSGSTYYNPDEKRILLPATFLDTNPTDPYEPNDTPADAKPIAYGQTTNTAYIYGKDKDYDYFKFAGTAGDQIKAEMLAAAQLGGQLDSLLYLVGPDGKVLAFNDDRGTPRIDSDSEITFTLPATGTYYLVATSWEIGGEDTADNNPFNKYKLKLAKTN
ncbi:S8 family serine peptidase [Deinococcus deserti]|uniref:Putative subtilase-type serine protease n=1 Tax=Deinococcus deserti (strain DSM 17065 / CIP 109153 / LMG 22923 / VCD115) TaxID=546414 RepID=C1CZK4_DEIDV|nr:S8 family serine peptidase [Deinococcus deserti]ACO47252.1 putative subtilase-type serine protease precursor [Deinococcus deserti VCD115]